MQQHTHILLVEDDINLSTLLADFLISKGYKVDGAKDGEEAWEMLSQKPYDLLLTDIVMPRMNGWQLMKHIQESQRDIPIIVISNKSEREDIIRGYQLGCDDYLTKPYSMEILICKIEAILRRYRGARNQEQTTYDLCGMHFDSVKQTLDGQHLSAKENELLLLLCQNMDKTVERSRLLISIWGSDTYFNSRSLSVYINHLRKLMAHNESVKIISQHGKGYKLVKLNE